MAISASLRVYRLPVHIYRALDIDDDCRKDGRHWYMNRDLLSEGQRGSGAVQLRTSKVIKNFWSTFLAQPTQWEIPGKVFS